MDYKAVPIDMLSDMETKKNEILLEYGYDIDNKYNDVKDIDNLVKKPLNNVNKEYFSSKR